MKYKRTYFILNSFANILCMEEWNRKYMKPVQVFITLLRAILIVVDFIFYCSCQTIFLICFNIEKGSALLYSRDAWHAVRSNKT